MGHKVSANGQSPAGRVMDRAIELNLEGRSPYPDRALFLDADCENSQLYINDALRDGCAVILVAADESTTIIHPEGE